MKPRIVIRNPQYRIVWDLISEGITRSASLAKVNAGNSKTESSVRIFFIMVLFWLLLMRKAKVAKYFKNPSPIF